MLTVKWEQAHSVKVAPHLAYAIPGRLRMSVVVLSSVARL